MYLYKYEYVRVFRTLVEFVMYSYYRASYV